MLGIFLRLIVFANTAVFLFSAGISLTLFWEGDSGEEICMRWRCVEKNQSLTRFFGLFWSLLAGFSYLQSYPRKFLLCLQRHRRKFRDNFFFSWETLYSALLSLTYMLSLCQIMPMFWSRWLLFWVWSTVYLLVHMHTTFFCYSAVAHILTPSVNLAFELKLGFNNKCRACDFELGPGSGFKTRPFYNSVWECMQGATRRDWKDASSTHQH